MNKGDRYECRSCGLVLSVDAIGTDADYELNCCDDPMVKVEKRRAVRRKTSQND